MPTDEQRALWATIRANPDDDTPRLVYADWLQEHGDEARAEFIRLQIEQNGMFSPTALCSDPNERTLTKREAQLIRLHGKQWLQPLAEKLEPARQSNWSHLRKRVKFARGFACDFLLPLRAVCLLAVSDSEIEPVDDVKIESSFLPIEETTALIREVAVWPGARCVKAIKMDDATDTFLETMTNGCLTQLRTLDFHASAVSDVGAILLASWPHSASLRLLNLSDNHISDAGALSLAEPPYLDGLVHLYLWGNLLTATGRARLRERFGKRLAIESEP